MARKTTTPVDDTVDDTVELTTIDPAALAVDDQVRFDATPDPELIDSVKRFGIMQPPTVYWDPDRGEHVVVIGHRRVGAAIAAGLTSIKVLVRPAEQAKDAQRTERQLVENERRKSITPAETAAGYKRLTLFGLTPADIAAQVGEKPERVKAAIAATSSTYGQAALDKGVDLEQAALIAEFDDDPTVQAELTGVALNRPENFRGRVAQVRAVRESEARRDQLRADAAAQGVTVVDETGWDDTYWNGGVKCDFKGRDLDRLGIRPEEHLDCPGHAARINALSWDDKAALVYVCTDYEANGHPRTALVQRVVTPEEIAAEQLRVAKRAAEEQQRAAMAANSTARREWLRGFLTGRLNQTAGVFDLIADATIGKAFLDQLDPYEGRPITVNLLTGENPVYGEAENRLAELVETGQITPLRALVAAALGTCEYFAEATDTAEAAPRLVAAYFDRLTTWKYELTDLDNQIQAAAREALNEQASTGDPRDEDDEPDDELDEDD